MLKHIRLFYSLTCLSLASPTHCPSWSDNLSAKTSRAAVPRPLQSLQLLAMDWLRAVAYKSEVLSHYNPYPQVKSYALLSRL